MIVAVSPMTASPTDTLGASAPCFSHVDEFLNVGQQAGASDIHLAVNSPPFWRLHGTLKPIWPNAPKLSAEDSAALAKPLLNETRTTRLTERGDADFSYTNDL